MLVSESMIRATALCLVLFAGCGGDPPIIYLADSGTTTSPDAGMMMMPAESRDFGARIFGFGEASVFGINGSFRLELSAFTGTPLNGGFTIKSNSGSDEAAGQITVDASSSCTFVVTTSSFPSNAKVLVNATILATCTFDQEKSELHLGDPMTGMEVISDSCDLLDDAGPCMPGGEG
jgi:hypothetical protein